MMMQSITRTINKNNSKENFNDLEVMGVRV